MSFESDLMEANAFVSTIRADSGIATSTAETETASHENAKRLLAELIEGAKTPGGGDIAAAMHAARDRLSALRELNMSDFEDGTTDGIGGCLSNPVKCAQMGAAVHELRGLQVLRLSCAALCVGAEEIDSVEAPGRYRSFVNGLLRLEPQASSSGSGGDNNKHDASKYSSQGRLASDEPSMGVLPFLHTFLLDDNTIYGEVPCQQLARLLRGIPSVVCVRMNRNFLGDAFAAFAGGIPPGCALRSLDICRCFSPSSANVKALAGLISTCHSLAELNISRNDLGPEAIEALAAAMSSSRSCINSLDITTNGLTGESGGHAVALMMRALPRLTNLRAEFNDLGEEGINLVASALTYTPLLEVLQLMENSIGPAGATALAKGLCHVPRLKVFDVNYNQIGDIGATALAAQLHVLPNLKTLAMTSNGVGVDGAVALAAELHRVCRLEHINLLGGPNCYSSSKPINWLARNLRDAGTQALARRLHVIPLLTELWIGDESVRDAGAIALSEALPMLTQLNKVWLKFGMLEDSSVLALARSLAQLRPLDRCSISSPIFMDVDLWRQHAIIAIAAQVLMVLGSKHYPIRPDTSPDWRDNLPDKILTVIAFSEGRRTIEAQRLEPPVDVTGIRGLALQCVEAWLGELAWRRRRAVIAAWSSYKGLL